MSNADLRADMGPVPIDQSLLVNDGKVALSGMTTSCAATA
jgi:hypothetical protein